MADMIEKRLKKIDLSVKKLVTKNLDKYRYEFLKQAVNNALNKAVTDLKSRYKPERTGKSVNKGSVPLKLLPRSFTVPDAEPLCEFTQFTLIQLWCKFKIPVSSIMARKLPFMVL